MIYQQTKADEFRHRYHYDADNRITHVYTSRNGMIWQRDAKYFYYPHGPLARVEVGHEQVQAFDYAYTLHGWLKGVNTNTLVAGTDIGNDGRGDETNPNRWFGQDAAGFSLGYYDGDYQAIGQNGGDFLNANLQAVYTPAGNDLFNGNISHMVTAIHQAMTPSWFTPVPQATTYRYDRLNRIKQMKAYQGNVINGVWEAEPDNQSYSSAYKYDFNGNITELERYAGVDKIDDLEYYYDHEDHPSKTGLVSNRLYLVDEQSMHPGGNDLKSGTKTASGFDRATPSSWNYHYDPIGNLIKDVNDSIDLITWTVTGKVSEVVFDPAKQNYNLAFRYDPMGNRIAKIQKPHNSLANCTTWTVTWYARDAQGNVLAVYNKPTDSLNFRATEFNIYGSSRIGMVTSPEQLNEILTVPVAHSQILGNKVYEFSNHLGNVLTTFSDRKIAVESISDIGYVAYYTSEILSSTDYYPFGFQMPGRVYEGNYRYGFNGMEKDDEVKGNGNSYDFGARIYDPRVGRWLAVDPLAGKYTDLSPFSFTGNNPICFIDPNGKIIRIYYDTGEKDDKGNHIIGSYDYGSQLSVPNNQFVVDAISALDHLKTNLDAKAIVDEVSNSEYVVELRQSESNSALPTQKHYERDLGLDWNSAAGYVTNGTNENTGSNRIPPAGTLLHELTHKKIMLIAFTLLDNLDKQLTNNTITQEEYNQQIDQFYTLFNNSLDEDAIVELETPIQKSLGWGFRKAETYESPNGFRMSKPAYEAGLRGEYKAKSSTSLEGVITRVIKYFCQDLGWKIVDSNEK